MNRTRRALACFGVVALAAAGCQGHPNGGIATDGNWTVEEGRWAHPFRPQRRRPPVPGRVL